MKNKRGQIFLLAAIVIVIAVAGLVATGTFVSIKASPKVISNLKSDLSKESIEIIDYGIYNKQDIEALLDDFLISNDKFAAYFLKKTDNANVIFVYGDKTDLKAVKYNTISTGTISVNIGGDINWEEFGTFAEQIQITPINENIIVNLQGRDYTFKLRDNEMFYFIIIQEKQDERYIETNQ